MSVILRKGEYYTITEAAQVLGVTPMTMFRWIRPNSRWYKKKLKVTHIGKLIRFHAKDLAAFQKTL